MRTSNGPANIQAISKDGIHRITSGQVVLDLQGAVKELVENALDAGARAIEVRFKEHGTECIEVIDNGTGIGAENYDNLALKHHTSKLSTFQDLASVQTFGFRGEALSSLCELSKVSATTSTQEEEPVGTVLEFNRDGTIYSKDKKVARQRGTTITVTELFSTLPVRRRELVKNVKREFAKAQALLQAYVIISRGIRWVVTNSVNGRKSSVMIVTGADSPSYIRTNVSAVFGPKAVSSLIPLDLEMNLIHDPGQRCRHRLAHVEDDDETDELERSEAGNPICVHGLISRPTHGSGRTSSDRNFIFLNGRPWDSSRVIRAFNEVYKSFNNSQYPMVIADFALAGDRYDVNVSPDKRTLFLHDEGEIIEGLKTSLENLFSPYQSVFTVNGANLTAAKDAALQSQLPFKSRRFESQNMQIQASDAVAADVITSSKELREHSLESEDRQASLPTKRRKVTSASESLTTKGDLLHRKDAGTGDVVDEEEEDPVGDSGEMQLDSTLASWNESQSSRHTVSASSSNSARGRRASQATIEAKLQGPTGPTARVLRKRLTSLATPLTADDEECSTEEDLSEPRDGVYCDDLEHREEGLDPRQKADAETLRDEYETESRVAINEGPSLQDSFENERREVLSRLEQEATDEDAIEEKNHGWRSEIFGHPIEISGGALQVEVDLSFLQDRISRRAQAQMDQRLSRIPSKTMQPFLEAGVEESDVQAVEAALSRSIVKTDFSNMAVIGQFNLGFILVRRTQDREDDVFIVDQHAADEKYNFEILQREVKIKSQALIRPRTLELPSSVEFVAGQHINTLAARGFSIRVQGDALPGARVELLALPICKDTAFGISDLEELLHRLAEIQPESERAQSIRCSKLNNMFASRACRKSVMVGRALTTRQMKTILRHMGEIEQPWNCPHGRPTMRHLHQLDPYPSLPYGVDDDDDIKWQSLL